VNLSVDTAEHPPWVHVARFAIPVVVVGALLAAKPEIVRGTFSSAESVLRVAAVIAACTLFSWLMKRVIPNPLVRSTVVAVPAALLIWVNVAPYFKDDVKIAGGFPEVTATTVTPAADAPAAAGGEQAPAPAQPVQLSTGRFVGLDGHRGSGEASIFRLPDGSHVVAFRDVSVSSVPDPVLYVVPGAGKESTDGGVRLGRFDGSRDRYEIPAGVDVKAPITVLVWCQRFAVPVAGATQA
jgi:hypothetical protein